MSEASRAHASRAVQAESSGSQSAAADDQGLHGVQAAQTALSELHLSTSSEPTAHRSGAAATFLSKSTSSTAPRPRIGPAGAALGSLLAPSSKSIQTQLAANIPPRAAQPRTPISRRGDATLTSGPESISQQAAEIQRSPEAKAVPSATPRPISETTRAALTQSRRGPLSATPVAQGEPVPQKKPTRHPGPGSPLGLRMPRSRSLDTDPTSEGKPAPQSSEGATPYNAREAGPSSARTLTRGLGRGAASLSSGRFGQAANAAPLTIFRQSNQSSAAETIHTGVMTAMYSDTEASVSEVSRAKPQRPCIRQPKVPSISILGEIINVT